jgi:hypothetical protein
LVSKQAGESGGETFNTDPVLSSHEVSRTMDGNRLNSTQVPKVLSRSTVGGATTTEGGATTKEKLVLTRQGHVRSSITRRLEETEVCLLYQTLAQPR